MPPASPIIEVTPEMSESARSIGVATVAAMVSALAPGSEAPTVMVGKSTLGRSDTGSARKLVKCQQTQGVAHKNGDAGAENLSRFIQDSGRLLTTFGRGQKIAQ